jgi:dihydrolipoamide dehydrogenase
MEFMLDTKGQAIEAKKDGVSVRFEDVEKKAGQISGDICLVAVGRKAFSNGVGLETVGVEKDDRGRIKVNAHLQTNIPNIYAIGDVVVGPMLAHKAEEEGVAVAETLAGGHGHVNYETVPGVVYTWPELASVGKTEEELKAAGITYKSGSFPFSANGRAKALGSTDGMVKVLADAKSDRILGVHIVGPRASDMIAEAVVAMEFGGSSEDLARSFHAHPTLSEAMREAALAVDKRARQM